MRLKYLWVEDYKNLKDFSIDFQKGDGLTMLIGTNGSGKSNIIEAISAIFLSLGDQDIKTNYLGCNFLLCYGNEDGVVYLSGKGKKAKLCEIYYNVEAPEEKKNWAYKIEGAHSMGFENLLDAIFSNEHFKYNDTICSVLKRNSSTNSIPKVIAIYSGEESRLWDDIYEKPYKRYLDGLKGKKPFQDMRMAYLNKHYWNIALLIMLLSENENTANYIRDELVIRNVNSIDIQFDFSKANQEENISIYQFLKLINNSEEVHKTYTVKELRELIFYRQRLRENGDLDFDTGGNPVLLRSGANETEVFWLFVNAFMPKNRKCIKEISISFNDMISLNQLSEGEKKLLLLNAVNFFMTDNNTIILLDEPDAHIHESKKVQLYRSLLKMKSNNGPQILVTSHSPTFVDITLDEQVIALRSDEEGNIKQVDESKIQLLQYLTGNRMHIFSNKEVIYCESGENGLDKGLLEILFPNKTIIATGSCEDVINKTKLHNSEFPNAAIGVIDSDYHNEDRKTALESHKIYMLPVLEIENVLMDFAIVEALKEAVLASDDNISQFKNYFFDEINKNKNNQSAKHTSNIFINEIKMSLQAENRDVGSFKEKVQSIVDISKIDTLYADRLSHIEKNVKEENYEELIKRIDFNHNIDRFFAKYLIPFYSQRVLKYIDTNSELQNSLRQKYYSFIN